MMVRHLVKEPKPLLETREVAVRFIKFDEPGREARTALVWQGERRSVLSPIRAGAIFRPTLLDNQIAELWQPSANRNGPFKVKSRPFTKQGRGRPLTKKNGKPFKVPRLPGAGFFLESGSQYTFL